MTDAEDPEFPIKLVQTVREKVEKENFLRHLELFTDCDLEDLGQYYSGIKKRKIEYRNLTYIPEMTEASCLFTLQSEVPT